MIRTYPGRYAFCKSSSPCEARFSYGQQGNAAYVSICRTATARLHTWLVSSLIEYYTTVRSTSFAKLVRDLFMGLQVGTDMIILLRPWDRKHLCTRAYSAAHNSQGHSKARD